VVLAAGLDLDRQGQAQLADHVGMVDMGRPAGLVRVVADLRPLLVAKERLDRGVDVQDPGLARQRPDAVVEMPRQPGEPRRLVDPGQRPAHRILAHHLAHAEQPRVDPVGAQAGDVGVAAMPRQHRQQHRAQHVAHLGRVGAGVGQRTVRHPGIEQPAQA
jgi:hypothetical protein